MIKYLVTLSRSSRWDDVKKFSIKAVYVYLIVYFSMIIFIKDLFFGPNKLVFKVALKNQYLITYFPELLKLIDQPAICVLFIFISILLILYNFFKVNPLIHILIVGSNLIINCFTYPLRDGGTAMLEIFLFFSIFWLFDSSESRSYLRRFLSNLSFIIFRLHLISMYISAVLLKVSSPYWQKGVALYYILTPPDWSTHFSSTLAQNSTFFVVFGTYSVILIQMIYPTMLLNKKTKLLGFLLIVLLHLGIIFFMRLFYFGTLMIILNFVFFNNFELKKIIKLISQKRFSTREVEA